MEDRGENARYEMFSKAGNDACEMAVQSLIDKAKAGEFQRADLPEMVRLMEAAIVKAGHDEVGDTEPQQQIAIELSNRLCAPMMWLPIGRWDW